MSSDYEKMVNILFLKLVDAYRLEISSGRHPRFRIQSFSKPTKTYDIRLESEQVNERFEMNPREFVRFTDLLKENKIELVR